MGLDSSMQLIMSGVLNVTQLVGVSTSVWTMDRFGRRPLLLVGSACMTISHVIIAILVGLFSNNWPAHRPQGWVSVAFLFFYMLSFGASWGPVPWAMPSEIFPSSLRAKGKPKTLLHTDHRSAGIDTDSQASPYPPPPTGSITSSSG